MSFCVYVRWRINLYRSVYIEVSTLVNGNGAATCDVDVCFYFQYSFVSDENRTMKYEIYDFFYRLQFVQFINWENEVGLVKSIKCATKWNVTRCYFLAVDNFSGWNYCVSWFVAIRQAAFILNAAFIIDVKLLSNDMEITCIDRMNSSKQKECFVIEETSKNLIEMSDDWSRQN